MKIEWDESYAVDNGQIDEQHKKWFEFYNRLDEVMSLASVAELFKVKAEILKDMSDYVDYHFQSEEAYMGAIGYPGADKHWRLHKDFRNRIYKLNRDFINDEIILNSEVMDVIKNWILNHIVDHDIEIRRFLQAAK